MAGLTNLNSLLVSLMIIYGLSTLGALLASIPMILHVQPRSECLLFSTQLGDGKIGYGNYASCAIVGWVNLIMVVGAIFLTFLCWAEYKRRSGHAKTGKFEKQYVPRLILTGHIAFLLLSMVLTIITTAGYQSACDNLTTQVSSDLKGKLNKNPYDTRGEEIQSLYEEDLRFHRYTNKYGNAYGTQLFGVAITCRSILTDPDIHQKLHDTHYDRHERYYGYWGQQDIYPFDSETEAVRINALVESSLAGGWICTGLWILALALIAIQKYLLNKQQVEADRVSVHSAMMGGSGYNQSAMGGSFMRPPGQGSVISGRSGFQRGGPSRGSDRSIKSVRRDVDDIALSSFMGHMGGGGTIPRGTLPPMQANAGYGRKDMDDMIINQHINANRTPGSRYSSMETGYVSDSQPQPRFETQYTQPDFSHLQQPLRQTLPPLPVVPQPGLGEDPLYTRHYRDEVETEIF